VRHDRDVKTESKIFVKGIPSDLDSTDIKDYFSQYGIIKSINIPWAGKERKDFGFVEFSSEAASLLALQQPSHEIKSHVLQVSSSIAKRRSSVPGKVVVDLLPDSITLEDVKKYFEKFGQLNSIDMVFKRDYPTIKNLAFLSFQNEEIAEEISNSEKKHYIHDQEVIVQPMYSTSKLRALSREKKVFVEDIPLGKTEDEILACFSQFGEALHIHLIDSWATKNGNQCGILRFRKREDVDYILSLSEVLMEDCPLKVRRLGYTAKTSSDYTPLYLEFRKKHRLSSTDTKENFEKDEEVKAKTLNHYPMLE
jgi:hypothetical protein